MSERSVKFLDPETTTLKSHWKVQAATASPSFIINLQIFRRLRGKKCLDLVLTRQIQLTGLNKRHQGTKWGPSFIDTPVNRIWTLVPALMRHPWKKLLGAKSRPVRDTSLAMTSKRIPRQRPAHTTMDHKRLTCPSTLRLASVLTPAVRDFDV